MLLTPLMGGMIASSVVSGRLITRTGRYKRYPLLGTLMMAGALGLLATMDVTTSRLEAGLFMSLLGIGMGLVLQNLVLVAQNDVGAEDLGAATATVNFTRSLGGSIGTAVFGAVMASGLASRLQSRLPSDADLDPAAVQGSPQTILALEPEVRDVVVTAFSESVGLVFLVAVPLALLAFLLVLLIPEVPLRETRHVGAAREDVPTTGVEPAAAPADTRRPRWGRRHRSRAGKHDRDAGAQGGVRRRP
jgi:MFS family permease